MLTFDKWMSDFQTAWRQKNISDPRHGEQNGKICPWILPEDIWLEGIWQGIRNSLPEYLAEKKVEKHKGVHNLKSSWAQCANIYFPFGQDKKGLQLLAQFLKEHVSPRIEEVESLELEYEHPDTALKPQNLLGEPDTGQRGLNQTSPDVAFLVRTSGGKGLILVENKLTEHSFYDCSGRKPKAHNPDSNRCLDWARPRKNLTRQCWQLKWKRGKRKNRRYWEHVQLSKYAKQTLRQCPAANGGYQIFRQQALAEGISAGGKYDLVMSCVAYDGRNEELLHCLRNAGVDNFSNGWGKLFEGRARFEAWPHQLWVSWVRAHNNFDQWSDWLSYVEARYGYKDESDVDKYTLDAARSGDEKAIEKVLERCLPVILREACRVARNKDDHEAYVQAARKAICEAIKAPPPPKIKFITHIYNPVRSAIRQERRHLHPRHNKSLATYKDDIDSDDSSENDESDIAAPLGDGLLTRKQRLVYRTLRDEKSIACTAIALKMPRRAVKNIIERIGRIRRRVDQMKKNGEEIPQKWPRKKRKYQKRSWG